MPADRHDIVIAGGGMIGTSLAVALAPLGLDVAVVEPVARGAASQPSFDDRSTALSRSSRRMFEAMGLWPEIDAASTPITSIHVSDRGRFGFSHIDAAEQGVEALGHVVINRVLGEVLQRRVDALDGLRWLCPARITGAAPARDGISVEVEAESGKRTLACSLLVVADGARSAVRAALGIGASSIDYGQSAVTGNLLPELPIANRAFERFTDDGALALLPLAEGRAAFVWVLPTAEAATVAAQDDAGFLERLQAAFGWRLGRLTRVGRRTVYPLALTRAERLWVPRAVLVGNAAHGLHPVAAQGFNLGLRDVAALCDLVADAAAAGRDIGDDELLLAYADWRRADHRKVVWWTDGLVRLFGSRRPGVRLLRDVGMLGFDLVPGVRGAFARHAMGLAGRLPRLARGVPLE
jgi:2-octaprenyl-6-methoxyphenol hydroxylase